MWDKILTDTDGPYAELMVGAFSDNQPDYSWIKPYEVKTFKQYWYPVRDIGGFKNANLNAAVNLELNPNGTAKLGFCTTHNIQTPKCFSRPARNRFSSRRLTSAPTSPSHRRSPSLPARNRPI